MLQWFIGPRHTGLLLLLPLLVGCPQPAAVVAPKTAKSAVVEDPLDAVREALAKPTDWEGYRRLVDQINVAQTRVTPALPYPADRPAWQATLAGRGLKPEEIAEIVRPELTPLDAYHFDETALFRDAARSLGVDGKPVAERARACLDWTRRAVRLIDATGPLTPPQLVALRGFGTPDERTGVFLALATQAGLDSAVVMDADGRPWGVAVRDGSELLLYDARLGVPFPASWKQLLAKPVSLPGSEVTAEQAAGSTLEIPFALSEIAPRLAWVQSLVPASARPLWASDPEARLPAWRTAAGDRVAVAKSPRALAFGRAWRDFLPPAALGPEASGVVTALLAARLAPWRLLPPFAREFPGELGVRIQRAFAEPFAKPMRPGGSRDLALRGRTDEAATELSARAVGRRGPSLRQLEPEAKKWCDLARELTAAAIRTEREARERPSLQAAAEADTARQRLDHLRTQAPIITSYLEALTRQPLEAEAAYFLGHAKHEQAEGQRRQGGDNAARDSFAAANAWYTSYRINNPSGDAFAKVVALQAELIARTRPADLPAARDAVNGGGLHPLEKAGYLRLLE